VQRRSLYWMLQQERCALIGNEASTSVAAVPAHEQHWHGLLLRIPTFDTSSRASAPLYVNRLTGGVTTQAPSAPEQVPGGAC
jgi:hypothetical protein